MHSSKKRLLWLSGKGRTKYMAAWLAVAGMSAVCAQPPDGVVGINSEAQWGDPAAPFVFEEGANALHFTGSFASARPMSLRWHADIHVHDEHSVQLQGPISSPGRLAPQLVKRGLGMLTLSGDNTYGGGTVLMQGGLRVGSNTALGDETRSLQVNAGTQLEYLSGVAVYNAVQLDDFSRSGPGISALIDPVNADAIRWRVDSGEATQVGVLTGSTPFIKQGAGLLRLGSSGQSYLGHAMVDEGAFVFEQDFGGSIQVNRGARLQGAGRVHGVQVNNGGTLALASSRALTIQSNPLVQPHALSFEPDAILAVEVTPLRTVSAPYLNVEGAALLDGHVMAGGAPGEWQPSSRYLLLSASDGYGQTRFASVQSDLPFLTPKLDYDAHEVYLQLDRNDTPFEEVAETPDEKAVADVIDDPPVPVDPVGPVDPAPSPEQTPPEPLVDQKADAPEAPTLHDNVTGMTTPQAREAFRQLGGSWSASLRSGMLDDSRFVREAALQNSSACVNPLALQSNLCGPDGSDGPRFWSQAIYSNAQRDGDAGILGDTRDLGGIVMGLSQRLSGDTAQSPWQVGGFVGAQQSHWSRSHGMGSANINTSHAGLSLAGYASGLRLSLGAAHSWHRLRSKRRVDVGSLQDATHSQYRARTMQVFGEAALPISMASSPGASPTLEPFVRLAWVQNRTDAHAEQGGLAALTTQSARDTIWLSSLGLRLDHAIETAIGSAQLQAEVAWHHASGDVLPVSRQHFQQGARPTPFTSHGLALARQSWGLQLGVQGSLGAGVDLSVAYHGQYATRLQDHGARLTLKWAF